MLLLKNNQIPRGLIPLERLFDQDDIPLKYTLQPQPEEVEDCNVGTNENPKMVKISKYLLTQIKSKYVELLKQYKDVFAWSYEYLKSYDNYVIENKIPLKHGCWCNYMHNILPNINYQTRFVINRVVTLYVSATGGLSTYDEYIINKKTFETQYSTFHTIQNLESKTDQQMYNS
jgi:hypothetical protein